MTWANLFSLCVGVAVGFGTAALMTSGKIADLDAEIWDLRQRLKSK